MQDYSIYAVPLGGGLLGIAPLPGRGGRASEDLKHLHEWNPKVVISLTTSAEHNAHGVPDLGTDLQSRGARWVHFPVPDMSVPSPDQSRAWSEVERLSLSVLRRGDRVLVHCLGGCGRSGMVALRLMVREGEAPDAALDRLRSVRPCAVETNAQWDWATDATSLSNKER
ncbi:MAG: protein-tyrosine phosphatase family protein [Pseudomonadota bacterium]